MRAAMRDAVRELAAAKRSLMDAERHLRTQKAKGVDVPADRDRVNEAELRFREAADGVFLAANVEPYEVSHVDG